MVRRRRVEAAVPGAEEDQPVALVDGGRGPDRAAAAVLTRTGRRVPARVEHRVDLEAPAERARRGVERDDPAPVAVCAVGRVADVDVPLEDRGEEKIRVGSASSISQLGASGLPQITFFQTSEPSAASRQYIVLPPAK